MNRVDFVITYDISDPKRLRLIAKTMEQYAFRIQKSIFFYPKASQEEISKLILSLSEIMDKKEDDIRIYQVDIKKSLSLCSGIDLNHINLI